MVDGSWSYTALGHKLRYFRRWKAQFVTVGIIWMMRGIEGGNARGARLQYFGSARFAGSVGENEVVKGNACSQ